MMFVGGSKMSCSKFSAYYQTWKSILVLVCQKFDGGDKAALSGLV